MSTHHPRTYSHTCNSTYGRAHLRCDRNVDNFPPPTSNMPGTDSGDDFKCLAMFSELGKSPHTRQDSTDPEIVRRTREAPIDLQDFTSARLDTQPLTGICCEKVEHPDDSKLNGCGGCWAPSATMRSGSLFNLSTILSSVHAQSKRPKNTLITRVTWQGYKQRDAASQHHHHLRRDDVYYDATSREFDLHIMRERERER